MCVCVCVCRRDLNKIVEWLGEPSLLMVLGISIVQVNIPICVPMGLMHLPPPCDKVMADMIAITR